MEPVSPRSRLIPFGPPDALKISEPHLFYSAFAEGDASSESFVRRLNLDNQRTETLYNDSLRQDLLSTVNNQAFISFFPIDTNNKQRFLNGITNEQRSEKMKVVGQISDVVATESQGEWLFYATDSEKHVVYRLVTSTAFEFKDFSVFAGAMGKSGLKDGSRTESRFSGPSGLHLDKAGNVYVADTENHALRKITPEGVVSTVYQERIAVKSSD